MDDEYVIIFNDLGEPYSFETPKYISTLEDGQVINFYKSTLYEHRLRLALSELIEANLVNVPDFYHDIEGTERGLERLKLEVISRFGEENLAKIEVQVDLEWEHNKPPGIIEKKKRTKKKKNG